MIGVIPIVGDAVDYMTYETPPQVRVGLIKDVYSVSEVNLIVFFPTKAEYLTNVPYSEEHQPGHWSRIKLR